VAAKTRRKPKQSNKIKRARQRMAEAPLARLKRSLSIYEHTAADEIVAAHHLAAGLPAPRDPDLGIPSSELRSDAADDMAARRSDLCRVYSQWTSDLQGTIYLAVATAVLFVEHDPRRIDELRSQRKGTAKAQLIAAIRHFAALRGNVPAGIRDWKLRFSVDSSQTR
jgi:hypothetical protein